VYVDGLRALRDDVRGQDADLPLFLVGHSMGGLIAAAFLAEDQASFRGCVLSGPALQSDVEPPALVMAIVRLISWLAPTVPLIGLDPGGVSRDPDVVAAYVKDPLVHHGKATARLITELSSNMRAALATAPAIELPLLVMHGDADMLTSPAGSQALHDRAGSTDKTLKLYPGLYHEIFNEPERDEVLGDMSAWLEAHL
jgi:alpha-beta hydrolase superfamily lysophospholipase